MAELIPGPAGRPEQQTGRLPREENQASFYGLTLTNKRIVVELPDYIHSVDIEQVSELAFTVIPIWQRWDAVWGFVFRGGLIALVAATLVAGFTRVLAPGGGLAWLVPLAVAALGCSACLAVAIQRVLSAPTCVVNVATSHGVAGYPIRISSAELPAAKQKFREFLAKTMTVREDPSVRRTLGFGLAERPS